MHLHVLAAASGLFFTLIGFSYRFGHTRSVRPIHIGLFMTTIATVAFGARAAAAWTGWPPGLLVRGAFIAGITQYAVMRLARMALHRGPLSPLVCAVSLAFVPAVVYGEFVLDEPAGAIQYAGVAAGVLCVLAASWQQRGADRSGATGGRLTYAVVLFATFLANSVSFVVLKDFSARPGAGAGSLIDAHRDLYLAIFYGFVAVPAALDLRLARTPAAPHRAWVRLGLLATVGTMGGMWTLSVSAALPAAVVYTLSNVSSLLAGSVLSVIAFRERVSGAWWAMLAFGIAAVVLANAPF
jgi:hypothetical protein